MRLTAFSDVSLRIMMLLSALDPDQNGRQATGGQVLRTTEGDIPMIECEDQDGNCPLDSFCRLRNVLADAREAFYAAVDDVVISDLPGPARPAGPVFVELGLGPLAASFDREVL